MTNEERKAGMENIVTMELDELYRRYLAELEESGEVVDHPAEDGGFVWEAWMRDPKGEQAATREAASRARQEAWEKGSIEQANERYREWMMDRTSTQERIRRSRWNKRSK